MSTPIRHTLLALVCAWLCLQSCWASALPNSGQLADAKGQLSKSVRDYCADADNIFPCTCTLTTDPVVHELSCINHEGLSGPVPLDHVFREIEQSDHINEYESLVLVNNRYASLNESLFGEVHFHNISIYDSNFTSVGSNTFLNMASTLNYLQIKSNLLTTSIFAAVQPLKALDTLELNLGLRSFKSIPANALVSLPQLRRVTLNGVAQTISENAFADLPLLEVLKITNQVEIIESNAFLLANTTGPVTIDLSENRLNDESFADGFIQSTPDSRITLDLSSNWITYLPESVFRPFLEASKNNRIVISSNGKVVCGKCDTAWLIGLSTVDKSQVDIHCHIDPHYSIWDYDWSRCPRSGVSAISGGLLSPALLTVLTIQLWRLFVH